MDVLLLAVYAALYPTLLAAVVILLNQPRRLPLLAAYLAGGLTISITIGIVLVFAITGSGAVHSSRSPPSWIADLVVGTVLILVGVALSRRADVRLAERRRAKRPAAPVDHEAADKEPWSQRLLGRGSVPLVFLAALAINLPGAAYLIALKDIAVAHHSTGGDILLIVAFNLIMFLLAEIPLLGLIYAPETTDRRVRRLNAWFSDNGRRIAVVLSLALGIFLVVRGIAHA